MRLDKYEVTLKGLHELLTSPGVLFKMDLGKLYSATLRIRDMNQEKLRALDKGDEVTWTDPDGGKRTTRALMYKPELCGSIVILKFEDGSELECFACELS